MKKQTIYKGLKFIALCCMFSACSVPAIVQKTENKTLPAAYNNAQDSVNTASTKWNMFFNDPQLNSLIEVALKNNQELNITLQELEIAKNEIRARKGEYLPFVGIKGGTGLDKASRYTNIGAMENSTDITPGKAIPDPLQDYQVGAFASWEVDIWHKLRNAKKGAVQHYLASVDGKNFMVTNLIAEIARSYYELLALDNQLENINKNIKIQTNALEIVKLEKEATRVTELAVKRFEAQVLSTKSLQYSIQQHITETENRINYLLGRFPQPIARNSQSFETLTPNAIKAGLPAQLLANRPDVQQAEHELAAAKLDVKVAKARFYPSLGISAGVGIQAFDPTYLVKLPESLLSTLTGDLAGPLINRNAIKATYFSANAKQIQAVYNYERSVLNAYLQVVNQVSSMDNLEKEYALKAEQVKALTLSVDISNDLFKSAHADYMEVLLTQRDALEAKFDLIETKMKQMNAMVNVYQALGGGWK